MSQRDTVALATLFLLALIAVLAVKAIRRRSRQQGAIGQLYEPEALAGVFVAESEAKYVSTVFTDRPLERVVTMGLMHRGQAHIKLLSDGIQVLRTGERSFSIAKKQILDVSRASATIDRGVEKDGLVAISWMLGSTEVTTNFRISKQHDTQEFFNSLIQYKGTGERP